MFNDNYILALKENIVNKKPRLLRGFLFGSAAEAGTPIGHELLCYTIVAGGVKLAVVSTAPSSARNILG